MDDIELKNNIGLLIVLIPMDDNFALVIRTFAVLP